MERWLEIAEQVLRSGLDTTRYGLAAVALFTLFEFLRPAEAGQGVVGRVRNLFYLVQLKVLGAGGIAAWYAFGPRLELVEWNTAALPAPLLVAANLLAIDFLYYFYHRAQHRFRFLWAIHELHHADAELNATSSYRTFWLESPVQLILVATPTFLLFGGLGERHALTILGFSIFFLVFSHANIRLSLGPLAGWVIGPQVHRLHHSRLPEHRDQNFAQYFPVLDRVFGTYRPPARDEFPPTGAEELASDANVLTALLRPFRIWTSSLTRGLG